MYSKICEQSMTKEEKRYNKDLKKIKKLYEKFKMLVSEEYAISSFTTMFDNGIMAEKMTEEEAIKLANEIGFEYSFLPFRS